MSPISGNSGYSGAQNVNNDRVYHQGITPTYDSAKFSIGDHGNGALSLFDKTTGESYRVPAEVVRQAEQNRDGLSCRHGGHSGQDKGLEKLVEKLLGKLEQGGGDNDPGVDKAIGKIINNLRNEEPPCEIGRRGIPTPPTEKRYDPIGIFGEPANKWVDFQNGVQTQNSGQAATPAAGTGNTQQQNLRGSLDVFKMGNDQNVKDHSTLGKIFDPIGMF
jgi:hypothetical protein